MLAAERPIQISMPILLLCMMMGPIGLIAGILATSDVKDDISIPSITQNEQDIVLRQFLSKTKFLNGKANKRTN